METITLLEKQLKNTDDYRFHDIKETLEKLPIRTFEDFSGSELDSLLQNLLSRDRYELFLKFLQIVPKLPYSKSYYRRSYRAPNSFKLHSYRITSLIMALLQTMPIQFFEAFEHGGKTSYMHFDSYYVTKDDEALVSVELFPYFVALLLNERDEKLEQIIRDILWKNGAHPMYSKYLAQGIVMSDHEDMHQLLGDVLLAAKNQEGARQVIAETMDEGTIEAQMYFMQLLLANDLTRFSSIVRAVDVWFGLGYEAKDQKHLRYAIETGVKGLQDEAYVEQLLASSSNLDVFIGIWVMSCRDVAMFLLRTDELMQKADYIQQTVLYALRNMEMERVGERIFPYLLQSDNLNTFIYGYRLVTDSIPSRYYYHREKNLKGNIAQYFAEHPWFLAHADAWLAKLEQFSTQIKGETHTIDGSPFTFLNFAFDKKGFFELRVLLLSMLKRDMELEEIAEEIPKFAVDAREYFYYYVPRLLERYDLLMPALKDRSVGIRRDAIETMTEKKYPLVAFKAAVPQLLTLKSGEMRQSILKLLSIQPIEEVEQLAEELLTNKKEIVRLGALELLIEVRESLTIVDWSDKIAQSTDKEKNLLAQLRKQEETFLTQPFEPVNYVVKPDKTISFTFKDLLHYDFTKLKQKLSPLAKLVEKHADYAYKVENYSGELYETLVGEYLTADGEKKKIIGSIDHLPLAEVWSDWLVQSELTATDICAYLYTQKISNLNFMHALTEKGKAFLKQFLGDVKVQVLAQFEDELYRNQVHTIMQYTVASGEELHQQKITNHFKSLKEPLDYVQFCSSMLMHFHATVDNDEGGMLAYTDKEYRASDIYLFSAAHSEMGLYARTPKQVVQLLYTMSLFTGESIDMLENLSLVGLGVAFEARIFTDNHVRRFISSEHFAYLLQKRKGDLEVLQRFSRYEELVAIIDEVVMFIVEQELQRGDMETAVTPFVKDLHEVKGVSYFIRILQALGTEKLSRQWIYTVHTRKESLSVLLQKVVLDENESNEEMFERLRAVGISDKRLIEAMLYNTRLIPLISEYIGWEGLEEVVWYFIAHTTEGTNDYEKAKITEYSAIPIQDFEKGAFDRSWFIRAHHAMNPSQFDMVYDAAKYSTSGANHRRAQLYAKASLGQLDAATLKEEIVAKRNQEKLRSYSLLPITMDEAKTRYIFFQQFLKESKQFGAQRRASEAQAVEMAIRNLAEQVAGGNTTQFIWQMENERYEELKHYFEPLEVEDVTFQLVATRPGKVDLAITKAGKKLKSVPKKLSKDETVLDMQAVKKEIVEQYQRAKIQLERAMCEETSFSSDILYSLMNNENLAQLLTKLIWCKDDAFYYIEDSQFKTLHSEVVHVSGELQIAHPAHFYEQKNWRNWQHFVFEKQWQQPFKQVFREFYVVTNDEKEQLWTNRFEGYQIQPNKAIALLKSRDWKVGYYEPIRKISYRYNLMTVIDFVYDYFTAAEVEAPTLQEVTFVGRLTSKQLKLADVPTVHFSEVMRDLDLVVSVAHAGEVDPEASHSTVEMRAVIIQELALLFGLKNVRVKAPHILVDGKLGQYSIHLGSGNVHQLGGTMIPVLAVPSQHRGRVFLPFVDEDPKTAEISSKVLLFADDENITDPQIRQYIV
ncbi:DUF5724 domain-containing protein [Lysinibacillus sphaericus]|uniref:DUF5724 domain-containing protein n=1 Tax=Lysinibacillus sphaericus TaxID=1421 RepID=UPI003D01C247